MTGCFQLTTLLPNCFFFHLYFSPLKLLPGCWSRPTSSFPSLFLTFLFPFLFLFLSPSFACCFLFLLVYSLFLLFSHTVFLVLSSILFLLSISPFSLPLTWCVRSCLSFPLLFLLLFHNVFLLLLSFHSIQVHITCFPFHNNSFSLSPPPLPSSTVAIAPHQFAPPYRLLCLPLHLCFIFLSSPSIFLDLFIDNVALVFV